MQLLGVRIALYLLLRVRSDYCSRILLASFHHLSLLHVRQDDVVDVWCLANQDDEEIIYDVTVAKSSPGAEDK
jgi:hypothetical protein